MIMLFARMVRQGVRNSQEFGMSHVRSSIIQLDIRRVSDPKIQDKLDKN